MLETLQRVKDEQQRAMLQEFVRRFDHDVVRGGSMLAFWLVDSEYIRHCEMYPQYIIVADGEIDTVELDALFFRLQDEYGWPCGHYFANSYSRQNVFARGDILDGLQPEDVYLDSSDIDKIRRGGYVSLVDRTQNEELPLLRSRFSRLGESISKWGKALEVDLFSEHIESYRSLPQQCRHPGVAAAIGHDFHRRRGKAPTHPTPVLQRIKMAIDEYCSEKRPQRHLLYGRINGCGKTQYLYHLMGYLQRAGYPFIYKELFYFHYRQHLKKADGHRDKIFSDVVKPEAHDPEMMTRWLVQAAEQMIRRTGVRPILLVDEEELDWSQLDEYFIVAADKNLPPYNDGRWLIYDVLLEDPIDEKYVATALGDELAALGIDRGQFGLKDTLVGEIARHSHVPHFHHVHRPSVYHASRLGSLCLLQAVRRKLREGGRLHLRHTDIALWAPHYWSKFVPRQEKGVDFHCEYIIFDGKDYLVDPYTEFEPEGIIAANAEVSTSDS